MKKIFTLFLLTAASLTTTVSAKSGDKFTIAPYTFTVLSEDAKTVKLSGYTEGTDTVAVIPATAKNDSNVTYTVTSMMMPFRSTKNLKKIVIPNTVTSVQISSITRNEALTDIVFPENSVKYIGSSAITNNNAIKTLILPNSIDSIASYGIFANAGVTTLKLPENLRVLDVSACSGYQSLTQVTIPESVQRLGATAFMNCFKLKSLHIPAGVKIIGDGLATCCDLLEEITVDPKNENFIVENGVLLNKDKTRIITVPCGNKSLTRFEVPTTVDYLSSSIFARNIYLQEIIVPESVKEIGYGAFLHCRALKEMKLPSGIKELPENLFYGCSALEKVWIPDVSSIHKSAFSSTTALKEVYYNCSTPVAADVSLFSGPTIMYGTLYVPEEAVAKAKTTVPWSSFPNIVPYDFNSGVTTVDIDDTNAPVEVYNLTGVKVADSCDNLPAGVYIVKKNGKTTKITL